MIIAEPYIHRATKRKPQVYFIMAWYYLWTRPTAELPNKVAIVDREMKPRFMASFFDFGHPCYGQLTPVKIRYPLTSIT